MLHQPSSHTARRAHQRGFTLIELLVVIGIIAVLMGILIPVVAHVRQSAYAASTQSQLLVIQAGIEQYRQTFEAYPGPLADSQLKPLTAAGPTSSENLIFGLLGGWDPATNNYNPALVGGGPASQNPLKAQRYQPFVDPTSAGLDPIKSGNAWVPWSNGAHANVSYPAKFTDTAAPEFVDRFPDALPILYIRTHVGATNVVTGFPNPTGTPAYDPQQLFPYNFPDLKTPATATPPNTDFANPQSYFGTLADITVPRQTDGYLLISAGMDRIYGTGDDITNGGKLK
jgi:prepilin-type N-terminal cleavage/methylation domain-containing protein